MKLLVIDDDPGMGGLLAKVIRRLGHDCQALVGPADAVTRVRDEMIEAVLIDAGLRATPAIELAALLRNARPGIAVAFIATGEDRGRMTAIGAILPRVWAVAQVRDLLAGFARNRAPSDRAPTTRARKDDPWMVGAVPVTTASDPRFAARAPMLTSPSRTITSTPPAVEVPRRDEARARKLRVLCRTWEQVRRLCAQHASGKTVLTLRGPHGFEVGDALQVALALPGELVLAIEATCLRADHDARGPIYGIALAGLTDEIRDRLLALAAENSSGVRASVGRPRATSALPH